MKVEVLKSGTKKRKRILEFGAVMSMTEGNTFFKERRLDYFLVRRDKESL